ncbi:CBS domain-containing protein [Rugosimonospora acidiphila]|uniref:CBS domain-containing protein n=1 Tax=Rugosimonospora acidiphila TaxID=556531 RepID=UPI0031E5962D
MQVRDAMTKQVLVVGPEHTIRQVARQMADRRVGSAVVHDPDAEGFGIMTERDILYAIGRGLDPDGERAANHLTWDVVYATPEWTLEDAAAAMVRGGFRHLVVMDRGDVLGVISVRDILRVWTRQRTPAATVS